MQQRQGTGPSQDQVDALIKLYTQGRLEEALTQGLVLAEQYPNAPFIPHLLGVVYNGLGRGEEAVASYDRAISLKPDYVDVYYNRGNALLGLGQLEAALASYDEAIALKPDYAEAYFNRGNALQNLNKMEAAVTSYDQAIALKPDYAEAYSNLGHVLKNLMRLEAAVASFDKAIALKPDYAELHYNRGNILQDLKQLEAAVASYDQAIALKPDYADAYYNRGNVLLNLKQPEAAVASYDQAIALKPDFAEAYCNRGNALRDLYQPDAALASYDQAIALKPDFAEAYSSRGNVLQELRHLDAALASYDQAIALKPDYADAYWNKALALLLSGDLEKGWELYEQRWETDDFMSYKRYFRQPLWTGNDIPVKKSILLHSEQGVGDEIMFSSCIPDLMKQAALCVLLCDPRLVPLFSRSFPSVTVIGLGKDPGHTKSELAAYATDVEMAIGSLPKYFRTSWADFPARESYLVPDEQRRQFWFERLASLGEGLKVGISWRGGKKEIVRGRRSTDLEQWQQLCSTTGAHFINLQYGDCQAELLEASNKHALNIHNWPDVDPLTDLDDFAALISALDLVISVDNSTVHMAGALGLPVWALLPDVPDWRWLLDRDDSPWYSDVKLYRQETAGDWERVFTDVKADLLKLCS